jgi:hypothetical protein
MALLGGDKPPPLLRAILDCGFWIADLLYRFALSFFIKLTEYHKSKF